MTIPDDQSDARGEVFSRLLMAERKRILGFIYALVQDRTSAEDVLQDVSAVLWAKFESFEVGTDFGAWAMCVARFTVLNRRRKQQKVPVALSDETLQLLADDAVAVLSAPEDERRTGLQECLRQLPARQRELIRAHYERDEEVERIAQVERRTARAIYLRLAKIHTALLDCIQHRRWKSRVRPEGAV